MANFKLDFTDQDPLLLTPNPFDRLCQLPRLFHQHHLHTRLRLDHPFPHDPTWPHRRMQRRLLTLQQVRVLLYRNLPPQLYLRHRLRDGRLSHRPDLQQHTGKHRP